MTAIHKPAARKYRSMVSGIALPPGRLVAGLAIGLACLMLPAVLFAQGEGTTAQLTLPPFGQILTFFFLMLGPIKIIGPFAAMTRGADPALTRQLAIRGTLFSVVALLLAAVIGKTMLANYGIPLHALALSAGLILFLVALQGILQQFSPAAKSTAEAASPTLAMALNPLAFPTIVTPYGTAALIIFMALCPTVNDQLTVGLLVVAIMLLNLGAMLTARQLLRFMAVPLQILGAILGIIQMSLGLDTVLGALKLYGW